MRPCLLLTHLASRANTQGAACPSPFSGPMPVTCSTRTEMYIEQLTEHWYPLGVQQCETHHHHIIALYGILHRAAEGFAVRVGITPGPPCFLARGQHVQVPLCRHPSLLTHWNLNANKASTYGGPHHTVFVCHVALLCLERYVHTRQKPVLIARRRVGPGGQPIRPGSPSEAGPNDLLVWCGQPAKVPELLRVDQDGGRAALHGLQRRRRDLPLVGRQRQGQDRSARALHGLRVCVYMAGGGGELIAWCLC